MRRVKVHRSEKSSIHAHAQWTWEKSFPLSSPPSTERSCFKQKSHTVSTTAVVSFVSRIVIVICSYISLSINIINTRTCVSCIIITRLSGCFRPIFTLRSRFPYNSYANRATLLVLSATATTVHTRKSYLTRAQNHNISLAQKKLMNSNYLVL